MVNKEEVVVHLPSPKMTLFGYKDHVAIPLATVVLNDPSKRAEIAETILTTLSDNTVCIMGNTLIYTDKYDAFKLEDTPDGSS